MPVSHYTETAVNAQCRPNLEMYADARGSPTNTHHLTRVDCGRRDTPPSAEPLFIRACPNQCSSESITTNIQLTHANLYNDNLLNPSIEHKPLRRCAQTLAKQPLWSFKQSEQYISSQRTPESHCLHQGIRITWSR